MSQSLRLGTDRWGFARAERVLMDQLNMTHPDLRIHGRPINSLPEFLNWMKKGEWDNQKREVIHCASVETWSDHNQLVVKLEKEHCAMLGIEFMGLKSNGTSLQQNHHKCCVNTLLVKQKGTLCTRNLDACKR